MESRASIFSDAIIGIVGTLTLIGLSALIIAASINIQGNQKNVSILSEVLGSGSVTTLSGLSMSQAYPQISALTFERKKDRISFLVPSKTGAIAYPE